MSKYKRIIEASGCEYLGRTLNEMVINEDVMEYVSKTAYGHYIDFFENVNRDNPFVEARLRIFYESHHRYSNTTSYTVIVCIVNKLTSKKYPLRKAIGYTASELDDGCFSGIFSVYDLYPSVSQIITSECERLLLKERHDYEQESEQDAL